MERVRGQGPTANLTTDQPAGRHLARLVTAQEGNDPYGVVELRRQLRKTKRVRISSKKRGNVFTVIKLIEEEENFIANLFCIVVDGTN